MYYLIPFDRNIVDVHMSTFDMNVELNTIFFLLDDGTVEYILIEDAIERNDFRSFGKLDGLNNIAKFYEGKIQYLTQNIKIRPYGCKASWRPDVFVTDREV